MYGSGHLSRCSPSGSRAAPEPCARRARAVPRHTLDRAGRAVPHPARPALPRRPAGCAQRAGGAADPSRGSPPGAAGLGASPARARRRRGRLARDRPDGTAGDEGRSGCHPGLAAGWQAAASPARSREPAGARRAPRSAAVDQRPRRGGAGAHPRRRAGTACTAGGPTGAVRRGCERGRLSTWLSRARLRRARPGSAALEQEQARVVPLLEEAVLPHRTPAGRSGLAHLVHPLDLMGQNPQAGARRGEI